MLYNTENLRDKDKTKLQKALEINKPLAEAYYLKEELSLLWNQLNQEDASIFLELWCQQAYETKLDPLIKFANTLKAHRSGIINWYDHLISTGPLEGMNNKIKVLKRKAYGYRVFQPQNTRHS